MQQVLETKSVESLRKMSGKSDPTHRQRPVFGTDTELRPSEREADAAYIRAWHRRQIILSRR